MHVTSKRMDNKAGELKTKTKFTGRDPAEDRRARQNGLAGGRAGGRSSCWTSVYLNRFVTKRDNLLQFSDTMEMSSADGRANL